MKAYIFVETGEIRVPNRDEWFIHPAGPRTSDGAYAKNYPILRRIEVEVPTPEDLRELVNKERYSEFAAIENAYRNGLYVGAHWLARKLGLSPELGGHNVIELLSTSRHSWIDFSPLRDT